MITESEFIAAADRTLAAIGAALDAALADSDADLDWSLNDGILEIECGRRQQAHREPPCAEPRDLGRRALRRAFISGRATAAGATRARATSSRAALGALLRAQAGLTIALPALAAPDRAAPRLRAAPSSRRAPAAPRPTPERAPRPALQNRARMVELDQVRDLVRDDVQREVGRQLDQPPVEPDHALLIAAPPFRAAVRQLHDRRRGRDARGVFGHPREHEALRLVAQPAGDERRDLPLVVAPPDAAR